MSSRHHGKRKHAPPREEPQVDDLLVASMAVASAWSPPSVENTESSDDDSDDDNDNDDGDDDGRDYCQDAHEIVLEDEPPDDTVTSSTTNDNTDNKIEEQKSIDEESDDDESDIDLTDHLAVMEEEDELTAVALTRKKDKNNASSSSSAATSAALGMYRGPKTEHEMDDVLLYPCPVIDELAKLNVRVSTTTTTTTTTTTADKSNNGNNDSKLDEATASKLRVAGVIRSYLVEQRTVVVDSLIPSSSQNSIGNTNNTAMDNPLDEGSVMAILLTTNNDHRDEVTISASLSEANSVQILGKVVEVFGPVQRPLYVIRLPEPPKVELTDRKVKVGGNANGKQCTKQSGDEIESDTKCSTAQIDEDTVAHGTKVTDGEITDTDREQALQGPTSSSTKCDQRNISDLSTKVEDPWCIGGKVSTVLRNTPNAIVYSVIDHSTVINKDQIIKISGKGCGES